MFRSLCMGIAISVIGPAAVATTNPSEGLEWQPEDGERLHFDVFRNGDFFGEHTVVFSVVDDEVRVESDIELEVKFGPIRVFHYAHDSQETWVSGSLTSLQGETRKDGDDFFVTARSNGQSLNIEGTLFNGEASLELVPSSHWNIEQIESDRILSTESGELLEIDVVHIGRENIEAGGQIISADRYRLQSDLTVDLWYDDAGRWVKCAFEARGQNVEYVLRE